MPHPSIADLESAVRTAKSEETTARRAFDAACADIDARRRALLAMLDAEKEAARRVYTAISDRRFAAERALSDAKCAADTRVQRWIVYVPGYDLGDKGHDLGVYEGTEHDVRRYCRGKGPYGHAASYRKADALPSLR